MCPEPYTPDWLNSLTDQQKADVARSDFGKRLHDNGCAHVSFLWWSGRAKRRYAPLDHHQGSVFFLDCGQGPFAVTAAHVYTQFIKDLSTHHIDQCSLGGSVGFDLRKRLIADGSDKNVDIATFRITPEEIKMLGKRIIKGSSDVWPSPPNDGEIVFFAGFPAAERYLVGENQYEFGLHSGLTPATNHSQYQILCRFNREHWIDVRGNGVPPPDYDFGGTSGGPLLIPLYDGGTWSWRLGGVIHEAQMSGEYEMLAAVRSDHILPDGRIIK